MAAYHCSMLVVFVLFRTIYCQTIDPCTNYNAINDVYRSTKYELQPGFVAICDDKLTTGWYRFKSIVGGMMPETKPSPNHCGTVAPIWIRDTHPTTKGQQKDVTACANIQNIANGCLVKHKISIKNCGGFYVYKLKRIYGCPAAYCAGDKKPCPRGQVGIVPNCQVSIIAHFPSGLLPTPTITYRDNPVNPLTMLCKFSFPNWKNVSFGIEWFTDSYSVKNDTICSDKSDPDCSNRHSELPALHPDQIRSYFKPGHRVRRSIAVLELFLE
ncbi:Oncoprotein-induced transcript 3 protein [Exaiptasia diaphana]|nr:Oncoprotein-induced transcript 3 protein [Exaiptasia diaphana]